MKMNITSILVLVTLLCAGQAALAGKNNDNIGHVDHVTDQGLLVLSSGDRVSLKGVTLSKPDSLAAISPVDKMRSMVQDKEVYLGSVEPGTEGVLSAEVYVETGMTAADRDIDQYLEYQDKFRHEMEMIDDKLYLHLNGTLVRLGYAEKTS